MRASCELHCSESEVRTGATGCNIRSSVQWFQPNFQTKRALFCSLQFKTFICFRRESFSLLSKDVKRMIFLYRKVFRPKFVAQARSTKFPFILQQQTLLNRASSPRPIQLQKEALRTITGLSVTGSVIDSHCKYQKFQIWRNRFRSQNNKRKLVFVRILAQFQSSVCERWAMELQLRDF